ncbi:EscU/YscU/HrcU family type III secretion system export apparatus switch protein [Glaciecola siphonariae]|uniref:Flagellar biosynthetic protein FlhB n=1 Tax=Glaciecola siphonariae TaxID=521012 RepID=A0ABV9LW83_9ALTE
MNDSGSKYDSNKDNNHAITQTRSQQAIALKYGALGNGQNEVSAAPKVIAKGSGVLADEIIALAEQHGIFIHQDAHLSKILYHLDLGQEIPQSMYQVIAELIAFSFVLQGKFPARWENTHKRIDFIE